MSVWLFDLSTDETIFQTWMIFTLSDIPPNPRLVFVAKKYENKIPHRIRILLTECYGSR